MQRVRMPNDFLFDFESMSSQRAKCKWWNVYEILFVGDIPINVPIEIWSLSWETAACSECVCSSSVGA